VADQGAEAERYQALHLSHNPSSAQFILGDNIAVVVINVMSARICNNMDKVTTWSAEDQ